jgi:predicted glycosyltransferase
MKVWIDLANPPHVPFFLPIMSELDGAHHSVTVTLRDFAQTVPLARRAHIDGTVVGSHGGRSRVNKLVNLASRSCALSVLARKNGFDLAVSHNSYTQIVAGRAIGARVVTLMDYEGQPANHLAFRLAHKILVPDCFPDADLVRFGASLSRVVKYPGYKEQVYLSDFEPDPDFPAELARACDLAEDWSPEHTIIVTIRTPATMAAYHRFDNPLFDTLLERVARMDELTVIVLPRSEQQHHELQARFPTLCFPDRALDGNNLIAASDLVISAGGTMNREAAVLGTPVMTVFAGTLPAVDRRLMELGRLAALRTAADVAAIRFERKPHGLSLRAPDLKHHIVQELVA